MTLEEELREILASYRPQREAEANALETRNAAIRALLDLNSQRTAMGLPVVGEYRDHQSLLTQHQWQWHASAPPPKTWRDELDARILAAVRKALT